MRAAFFLAIVLAACTNLFSEIEGSEDPVASTPPSECPEPLSRATVDSEHAAVAETVPSSTTASNAEIIQRLYEATQDGGYPFTDEETVGLRALKVLFDHNEGITDTETDRTMVVSESKLLAQMCEGSSISIILVKWLEYGSVGCHVSSETKRFHTRFYSPKPLIVRLNPNATGTPVHVSAMCPNGADLFIDKDRVHTHVYCVDNDLKFDDASDAFVFP